MNRSEELVDLVKEDGIAHSSYEDGAVTHNTGSLELDFVRFRHELGTVHPNSPSVFELCVPGFLEVKLSARSGKDVGTSLLIKRMSGNRQRSTALGEIERDEIKVTFTDRGKHGASFRYGANAPAFHDLAAVPGGPSVHAVVNGISSERRGVIASASNDNVGIVRQCFEVGLHAHLPNDIARLGDLLFDQLLNRATRPDLTRGELAAYQVPVDAGLDRGNLT